MGIVEQLLADFETQSGQQYRIELNEGGTIHIHTEHVRIDLTKEELLQLADAVSEGQEKLIQAKNEL